MLRVVLWGLVSFFIFSQSLSAQVNEGIYFSYKDWEIACDNTRTCRAAGYGKEWDGDSEWRGDVSLLFVRPAGAAQTVTGQVVLADFNSEDDIRFDISVPLTLKVGQQDLGALIYDVDNSWHLTSKKITFVINALKGQDSITFHNRDQFWQLSNSGAYAVMLKMDDFQGRLGTPDALIKTGDCNECDVLSPLPLPVIVAAPVIKDETVLLSQQSTSLRAKLAATDISEDCDNFDGDITVIKLNEHKSLLSMPCWFAAYNSGYAYWVINNDFDADPQLVTTLGSSYEQGVINSGQRGRGIGDCWRATSWVWNGDEFAKSESFSTGMCRNIMLGGPWQLYTYVSEIKNIAR